MMLARTVAALVCGGCMATTTPAVGQRQDPPSVNLTNGIIKAAIEPFIAIAVKASEQLAWTYTFDYYVLPR